MTSRISRKVNTAAPSIRPTVQIVKQRFVGMRLDQFLKQFLPWATRGFIQHMIQSGQVAIDGHEVRLSKHKVRLGMAIKWEACIVGDIQEKVDAQTVLLSQVKVLAEDEHVVVLAKPAGLAVHPIRSSQRGTLKDWLSTHYPQVMAIGENPLRPGIVHRLDKETSGVMVVAKTMRAFTALKSLFQERKVQKEYLALVYGNLKFPSGVVNLPIGRTKGSIRRAVPQGKREFGGAMREAITEYALHTRYPQYDLLLVKPKTGRTHQIRVHMAALEHPIVGDRLYRFKEHRRDPLLPPYQLLHAKSIAFTLFGKKYQLEAPLPEYYSDILSILALKQET